MGMFDFVGKVKCPNCGHLMTSHTFGVSIKRVSKKKITVDAIFCEECKGNGISEPCFLSAKKKGSEKIGR